MNSTSYRLLLFTALLWPPPSMGAPGIDLAAEIKKNLNVPVACSCSDQDKRDLESRIKQVEAAIKEYETLIKEWETKEKGAGESLLLTHENRGSVQGSVGFSNVRRPNFERTIVRRRNGCRLRDHHRSRRHALPARRTARS